MSTSSSRIISYDEIKKAEEEYNEPTLENQFILSKMYIKTQDSTRIKKGLKMLLDLKEIEKYKKEALYHLSLGYFQLGEYVDSKL